MDTLNSIREWFVRLDKSMPEALSYRGVVSRGIFLFWGIPVLVLSIMLINATIPLALSVALSIPLIIVSSALFVKRLRDAGQHPALVLLGLIPFFGWVALAVLSALPTVEHQQTAKGWKTIGTGFASFFIIAALAAALIPGLRPEEPVASVPEPVANDEQEALPDEVDPVPDPTPSPVAPEDDAEVAIEEEEAPLEEEVQAEQAPPASGLEELVSRLRVEDEFPSGYDRDLFRHWIDADGDGCDARREVLIEESVVAVSIGPGCSVSGQWVSAFDGRSTTDPSSFDIDHFVPLKEAWDSGAHAWDSGKRTRFANDLDFPGSLIAVSASSNRSKGSGDPAEWLPPNGEYRCEYLVTWVDVKLRWDLSADSREIAAIRNAGAGC